jgi:hypothetical protein
MRYFAYPHSIELAVRLLLLEDARMMGRSVVRGLQDAGYAPDPLKDDATAD